MRNLKNKQNKNLKRAKDWTSQRLLDYVYGISVYL